MKGIIKKAFLLGLGAATLTKAAAEKQLKALVKKKVVSSKDGKDMLGKILKEADKERKRIQEFATAEIKRIQAKVNKASQPQIKKLKEKVGALERKLKSQGKKTAKKVLKRAYGRV